MCKAFSCICPESGSVVWKFGVDSHEQLLGQTTLRDDTSDPNLMTFSRIEITPVDGNYRKALKHYADSNWNDVSRWKFTVDENAVPKWFGKAYEASCLDAHKKWCKQLYQVLDCDTEIVNPFKITPPKKILKKHIKLLKKWHIVRDSVGHIVRGSVGGSVGDSVGDSVWDSVWDSVGDSVWGSVRDSVWGSVRDSVGDSVWGSVRDSVSGNIGVLFRLPMSNWKYTENIKCHPCSYPFQSVVDLYRCGLVPSFDGKLWRLHAGPKAEVVFSISADELRSYK